MSKDLTWGADRMAKFIDVTPRRLQQLVQEGVIPKQERGRYNPFVVNLAYIRFLRDRVTSPDQSDNEMWGEKLGKTKAERELIELEIQIKREKRIPLADCLDAYEDAYNAIAAIIKSRRDKRLDELAINEIFEQLRQIKTRTTRNGTAAA